MRRCGQCATEPRRHLKENERILNENGGRGKLTERGDEDEGKQSDSNEEAHCLRMSEERATLKYLYEVIGA